MFDVSYAPLTMAFRLGVIIAISELLGSVFEPDSEIRGKVMSLLMNDNETYNLQIHSFSVVFFILITLKLKSMRLNVKC
jgi:hypothetical protein